MKWNVYDDKNARTPLCVRWQYAPKNVFPAQCNGMFVHNDDDSLISLYFCPTIFTVFCDIWCSTGYFLPFIPNGYLSHFYSLFFPSDQTTITIRNEDKRIVFYLYLVRSLFSYYNLASSQSSKFCLYLYLWVYFNTVQNQESKKILDIMISLRSSRA